LNESQEDVLGVSNVELVHNIMLCCSSVHPDWAIGGLNEDATAIVDGDLRVVTV
jgi:hypothetical protein